MKNRRHYTLTHGHDPCSSGLHARNLASPSLLCISSIGSSAPSNPYDEVSKFIPRVQLLDLPAKLQVEAPGLYTQVEPECANMVKIEVEKAWLKVESGLPSYLNDSSMKLQLRGSWLQKCYIQIIKAVLGSYLWKQTSRPFVDSTDIVDEDKRERLSVYWRSSTRRVPKRCVGGSRKETEKRCQLK